MKTGILLATGFYTCLASPLAAQLWKGKPGDIDALEKGAQAGKPAAMSEYAWHLMEAHGGRPYNAKLIYKHFSKAAEAGNTLGMVGLSRCLTSGVGTEVDFKRAWTLAEEASGRGHPEGMKQMALLLGKGFGVPKNRKKAIELGRKAVEGGSIAARVNLIVETNAEGHTDRYTPQAEIALRYGNMLAARNALWGYVFSRGERAEFERNKKLIKLVESRAALNHPDALLALAFVRSCQGDDDGRAMLYARAGFTGTGEGVSSLCSEIHGEEKRTLPRVPPIYTTVSDRKALQWLGYSLGERADSAVVQAALALDEGFANRKPDGLAARKILIENLPGKNKQLHYWVSRGNVRHLGKGGSKELGKLTVAHAVYSCDDYGYCVGFISYLLSGAVPAIPADLPKAHAAYLAMPSKDPQKKANAKRLEGKLSPEQIAEAERLFEEGYPTAEKFIEEARDILEEAGELGANQG